MTTRTTAPNYSVTCSSFSVRTDSWRSTFDTDLTTATQGLTLNVDGTAFAFEDAEQQIGRTFRTMEQYRTELERR